eukprot:scaffold2434_cov228-Ochromonas_danica.AAC.1
MSSGDSSSSRTRPCEALGPRFDPPSVSRGPRVSRGEARTSAAAGGSPPAREVLEWSGDGNASLADGKTPPALSNSSGWVWVVPKVVADATCATLCGPSTPPVVISNPCGSGRDLREAPHYQLLSAEKLRGWIGPRHPLERNRPGEGWLAPCGSSSASCSRRPGPPPPGKS